MIGSFFAEGIKFFRKKVLNEGLLSFLIPVLYRLMLEILAGRIPLGYDCATTYVEWVMYPPLSVKLLRSFTLYNFLLMIMNFVIQDAFLTVKIGSILISGFLGYSIYRWLKTFGFRTSLYYALLVFFSLPTLRLSWDLHRNCFGLSLALLSMCYMKERKWVFSYFLAFVAGFSHPFAVLSLVAMNFGYIFLEKNRNVFLLVLLSCLGYFSAQFPDVFTYTYTHISNSLSLSLIERFILGYIVGGWLLFPLIPFLKGIRKNFRHIVSRFGSENFWWLFWFLVASNFFCFSDRFFYMLGIPLCALIIFNIVQEDNKKREKALFCVIIVSMVVYTCFWMFNTSIPLKYTSEVIQLYEYCNMFLDNDSVVLVHRSLIGFALEVGIDPRKIIIVEPHEDFTSKLLFLDSSIKVFTVWWLEGKSWEGAHPFLRLFPSLARKFGVYDVPDCFKVIKKGVGFALYICVRN